MVIVVAASSSRASLTPPWTAASEKEARNEKTLVGLLITIEGRLSARQKWYVGTNEQTGKRG